MLKNSVFSKYETEFALLLVFTISLFFAKWFAINQINAVSSDFYAYYPNNFYLLTIVKCSMTIILFYAVSRLAIMFTIVGRLSDYLLACTFIPLIFSGKLESIWIILTIVSAQLLLVFFTFLKNGFKSLGDTLRFDLLVLLFYSIFHFIFTTRFSPLNWKNATLAAAGYNSEEIPVLAPVFKGYMLAKQFSFTTIDYSQWAGIMNPPSTLNSPLIQLISFIFNLPSASYEVFHVVYMTVFFIMAIVGSFGFYLYLKYAAKLNLIFSIFGGFVFFFGGTPILADAFLADGGIFIPSFIVFPYALLFISLAFEKQSYYYSAFAGVALASQFFFLSPHPEGVIYSLLFYIAYAGSLLLISSPQSLPFRKRFLLCLISGVIFSMLSAYTIVPILVDRFSGNMFVFAHIGDIGPIAFKPFRHYVILYIIFAPLTFYLLKRNNQISNNYVATLSLSVFLFLMFGLARNPWLMQKLVNITHIGLHLWVVSRIGLYLYFCITMIVLYGLNIIYVLGCQYLLNKRSENRCQELSSDVCI